MRQLEAKISEINKVIGERLQITCGLNGLSELLEGQDKKRKEVGTELVVSLDSDHDLSVYHVQDGQITFDRFQNRGKKKIYYPIAPLAMICLSKDRKLEETLCEIIKSIPDVTLRYSDADKYRIWRDETGKDEPNFDYHIFKIGYEFSYKTTECTSCEQK